MFLNEEVRKELKQVFSELDKKVELHVFSEELECRFCKETVALCQEVSEIMPEKIEVKTYNFYQDKEAKEKFGVERVPAIALTNEDGEDNGLRFFGVPSGYEFSSLVEAVKMVSTGKTMLSEETKQFLDELESPVDLQVFVTPSCPYCPGAVILALQMAAHSPNVKAAMVEAQEFPQLSAKFAVRGVPRTVINEVAFQEGAAPEAMIIDKIREALQ